MNIHFLVWKHRWRLKFVQIKKLLTYWSVNSEPERSEVRQKGSASITSNLLNGANTISQAGSFSSKIAQRVPGEWPELLAEEIHSKWTDRNRNESPLVHYFDCRASLINRLPYLATY